MSKTEVEPGVKAWGGARKASGVILIFKMLDILKQVKNKSHHRKSVINSTQTPRALLVTLRNSRQASRRAKLLKLRGTSQMSLKNTVRNTEAPPRAIPAAGGSRPQQTRRALEDPATQRGGVRQPRAAGSPCPTELCFRDMTSQPARRPRVFSCEDSAQPKELRREDGEENKECIFHPRRIHIKPPPR